LTDPIHFDIRRIMEKTDVVAALAALAQDNRLDTFRLLVRAGPDGLPAGQVAAALGLPPNTLSFHFDRLRQAGLVTVRRAGRSMIYAARFDTMRALLGYLTENCCEGPPNQCRPASKTGAMLAKKDGVA
jgi:ArsR family transcriptional regulator, arsenate/arsenite/antimonite-responsive transcriptional repressor